MISYKQERRGRLIGNFLFNVIIWKKKLYAHLSTSWSINTVRCVNNTFFFIKVDMLLDKEIINLS